MQKNSSSQLVRYLGVFLPTWFGAFVCASLMALTIVVHQFGSIRQTLGIPGGIDLQHMMSQVLSSFAFHVFGQTRTNTAVVALFWAIVGVFVYILVLGVTGALRELGSDVEEQSYLWPKEANPHGPLVGFLERTGVHLLTVVVLILYVLGPLAIILRSPLSLGTQSTAITYVVWFLVGVVVWHGLTVILRVLFFKDRLLG